MANFLQNRHYVFMLLLVGVALIWAGVNHKVGRFAVPEVDVAQAKAMIDSGALVIDVRGAEQFAHRHIPGSVLVPIEVLRAGVPVAVAAAQSKPVLVYCGDGITHGPEATYLLRKAGFTQVVNLKSGIEGWAASGLSLSAG